MNQFECKICNYTTKEKSNINRHMKSAKHLQKEQVESNINQEKNYVKVLHPTSTLLPPYSHQKSQNEIYKKENMCKYCSRTFSRPDTLSKHINTCKNKQEEDNELKDKIKELNNQLELFKNENKHYIKEVYHYKEETNYYKQMLREAGGLVKKSVSSLTYIVDNYSNAPALQTISIKDIRTLKYNEKKIIEDILSSYKHKTLSKYLGGFIIDLYKKDDPNSQSIWNTDDSRLTYLIKELLNNKSSNWIIDKKGIKTTEYLIDPLLLHIKKLLISYQKNLIIPELTQHNTEIEFILDNSKRIIELMDDIDDGIISKDILKYISCHLRFNEKLIKKVIE